MEEKTMLNVRVTEYEASILCLYCDMTSQTQTGIIRAFIRSLESKVLRITPETLDPYLLSSVPLRKHSLVPSIAAIYFFLTEDGRVLYVGRATNLHTRLATHHKIAEALAVDLQARVHWLERRNGQSRFETVCRKRFDPPLNERDIS